MQIDKSKPVLVTGANGFVASWLVKKLLEEGLTVHAAVRSPENDKKVGHLKKVAEKSSGTLKFFKADLLTQGAYTEAMQGCELVYHTASPFFLSVKDPQKDLIDPAKLGTRNVLESANKVESVKRVVVTSSCAAIYGDAVDCAKAPNGILTEEVWNTSSSLTYQPYSYSKTVAEQEAWKVAKEQSRWDLVTVNPSFVLGPTLNPNNTASESFNFVKQLGDGTMKSGAPKFGVGVVDVRDLAVAHFKAGFTPSAKGRYIASAHNTDFLELGLSLRTKYGADYPVPKSAAPKWLIWLIGPMMDKSITRKMISRNVNVEWKADNSKIKNELGVEFRSVQNMMEDAFQSLIDADIFKKK